MKETNTLLDRAYRLGNFTQFQAQLRPGFRSEWFIISTIPGQERIAAAHLIGRRFIVYVPEIECEPTLEHNKIKAGKKLDHIESMYPGYIFVLIWDIEFHWHRLQDCPGVLNLIVTSSGTPAIVSTEMLNEIKSIENILRPLHFSADLIDKKKRRWRRSRVPQEVIPENEIISVRTWSAFKDGNLDSEARNALLHRALGLAL